MQFEPDHFEKLERQALRRNLTDVERALSDAIEAAFGKNLHSPEEVAEALNKGNVRRPSGERSPWTDVNLVEELAAINASLDEVYQSAPRLNRYAEYETIVD